MSTSIIIVLTSVISEVAVTTTVKVPFLRNVTFVPLSESNDNVVIDRTCDQCLCDSNSSHMILNCFPNNTCQFFVEAPRTYQLQSTFNTFLYFPRQLLPSASQSCTPNISSLLNQLNTSSPTYAAVYSPACLVLDDHGYVVTISVSDKSIVRFHPSNLTRINQPPSPIFSQSPTTIAYHNAAYYVGFYDCIRVVDSSSMLHIQNISTPSLISIRDMIFLNDGQQMIVASMGNNRLAFFNRSNTTSHTYDFIGEQAINCPYPHGLFYGNESFFYLTSLIENAVYSYSYTGSLTSWTETRVLNMSSFATSSFNGYHVSIDNSGRYWFSSGQYGTRVFDTQGLLLGSLYPTGYLIFDTLVLENYVIYLSDYTSNRIIRIDPNIQC